MERCACWMNSLESAPHKKFAAGPQAGAAANLMERLEIRGS